MFLKVPNRPEERELKRKYFETPELALALADLGTRGTKLPALSGSSSLYGIWGRYPAPGEIKKRESRVRRSTCHPKGCRLGLLYHY